jgi:hypothetical protein
MSRIKLFKTPIQIKTPEKEREEQVINIKKPFLN